MSAGDRPYRVRVEYQAETVVLVAAPPNATEDEVTARAARMVQALNGHVGSTVVTEIGHMRMVAL